ncbi:MAG: TolC family protein [Prevotella sp.]|nr:TolC family protein [Prevotella sp.]
MKKFLFITYIFSFCTLICLAQRHEWSLQECIQYALDNNITVKQQDITRQQREIDVSTAKNSRLPNLAASASQNWSFGRGLTAENTYTNTNTATTSFTLATNVPIFDGLKTERTIALNKLNLQAATSDLEKARNDISVQVAQAYVQILYDINLRDVALRQIAIDSLQVVRLQQLYSNGKASGVEVAQQEATLANSRLTYTQADNDYRLALLDLTQLLELSSPEGFYIECPNADNIIPTEETLLMTPDEIFQEALAFKPEIQAELYRLKGTNESIKLAKSALMPTLSLNAGIGSDYYNTSGVNMASFSRQIRNNFSQYIGFSLNVPIFNRLETRNSIRNARLDQTSQQLQLDNVKKTLYKEIQTAYYNAVAAQAKYESSKEASRSSKAAFDLMAAKYEFGKANITEFNESKNSWLEAESDLVRAKYEYLYDNAILNFYRGKNIELIIN